MPRLRAERSPEGEAERDAAGAICQGPPSGSLAFEALTTEGSRWGCYVRGTRVPITTHDRVCRGHPACLARVDGAHSGSD